MYGVNINCKNIDYVQMILDGVKTVETRNTNSLISLVGQRIGLIRTGCGKAMLMGYATIAKVIVYDTETFRSDFKRHRVPQNSEYDIKLVKYGYILENVKKCRPRAVQSKGIVYRKL